MIKVRKVELDFVLEFSILSKEGGMQFYAKIFYWLNLNDK